MEKQKIRHEEEIESNGGGYPDIFSDGSNVSPGVFISYGIYSERLPVVGESIGRVRELYADRFDLDPESQAVIDGQPVNEDAIIEEGQSVVFVRRAGEKGINNNYKQILRD